MNKPHLFLARAGYVILWGRPVLGGATETWVIWRDDKPPLYVAGRVDSHPTPIRWVWASKAAATAALRKWQDSADYIPESEFAVCEVQGAFTAFVPQEEQL